MGYSQYYSERNGILNQTTIYDGGYRLTVENRGELNASIDVYNASLSDYKTVTCALYDPSGERIMPSRLLGSNELADFLAFLYEPGSDTGKEHTISREDVLLLHRKILSHTSKPVTNIFKSLVKIVAVKLASLAA